MSDSNEGSNAGKAPQNTPHHHPMAEPPKQGLGCFFYGCLTAVIAAVILAVALFFVFRMIWNSMEGYLDDEPVRFPQERITESEYQDLSTRLSTFFEGLESPGDPEPLVITGKDINSYLAYHPELKDLNDSVYFSIDGDQITGTISLPLDDMGMKGRYLNGQGTFDLALRNNVLELYIVSLTVRGEPLPEMFMQELRKENFASEFSKDPEFQRILGRIEKIQVSDGQVILTPARSN